MWPKFERFVFPWIVSAFLISFRLALAAEPIEPAETTNDRAQAAMLAMDQATAALAEWKSAIKSGSEFRAKDWGELQTRLENLSLELNWLTSHAPQKKSPTAPPTVCHETG